MPPFLNILNKRNQQKKSPVTGKKTDAVFFKPLIQPKLAINQPNDIYEQEADAAAEKVMRMPDTKTEHLFFQPKQIPLTSVQRKCSHCGEKEKIQMKGESNAGSGMTAPSVVHNVINSPGQKLDTGTRGFMESRFGYDFGNVQIHNDPSAHQSSSEINALAYTHGNHVVFGAGKYQPNIYSGKQLLAHELTHVVQQSKGTTQKNIVQKADLKSPRLAGNTLFEDVLDNKEVIEYGDTGVEVRRIQQLLVDLGISLPIYGVDGIFKTETMNAVKKFQKRKKLDEDGRVGFKTMAALDKEFPSFSLPADKADPWSMSCILSILCPWNKYLVEKVLSTYNITTFDSREYPTEKWDGSKWVKGKMEVGGFRNSKDLGLLNKVTCEEMAFIIYHEGWHAKQPAKLTGKVERETNAYINAEQWSIDAGVPGQNDFTNEATGKTESFRTVSGSITEVNETAAETFVKQEYGGVSILPGEVVIERDGATNVKVRKPDGSEYIRAANTGESVVGTPVTVNEKKISASDWVCS
jgi:hypothetical protein